MVEVVPSWVTVTCLARTRITVIVWPSAIDALAAGSTTSFCSSVMADLASTSPTVLT